MRQDTLLIAMTATISIRVWKILTCSYCGSGLNPTSSGADCTDCRLQYRYTDGGALDLRPQRPRKYELEFEIGTPLAFDANLTIEPLKAAKEPQVDFSNVKVPHHMTRELMSYFPRAKSSPSSLMLDLGCGDAVHKELCERAGFEWVGVDYSESSKALILADAHALPFKDEAFEYVLSVAAMQLFRFPIVTMQEVYRVLKPQGLFLGTVAFLEPFIPGAYYHHTHLGTINSLQGGGFTVVKLAPSAEWSALTALSTMALFPRMPRLVNRSIIYPLDLLHRLWWRLGSLLTHHPSANESLRIRNTTGGFAFVASKGSV